MPEESSVKSPVRIFNGIPFVVAFGSSIEGAYRPAFRAEMKFVESAVASRKREFAAGRSVARKCLTAFGCEEAAIPALKTRAPAWPRGFVGSISHSEDEVAAAVCRTTDYRALGLDIERRAAVTEDLFEAILTSEEIEGFGSPPSSLFASTIFCCKEAIYKAVHPIAGENLEFPDITVVVDGSHFSARCNIEMESSNLVATGRGILEPDDVFTRALFLIE